MNWLEGRRLSSVTKSGKTTSYTFDMNGLRTKKVNSDGTWVKYFIADGKIIGETLYRANNTEVYDMRYTFDENGDVCGISLWNNGDDHWTKYYFLKNLQGDVLAVYQYGDSFTKVAEYIYDSWGNVLSVTDVPSNDDAATVNPFRYRSYPQDPETGFYYLQSRYYDPAIGRFISVDNQLSTSDFLGANLFAYCGNNPVKLSDPDGHFPFLAITAAIGAVAGAVIGGIKAAKSGKSVWKGALKGVAIGGLIGLGAGAAAGVALAGSATASVTSVVIGAKAVAAITGSAGIAAGLKMIADNVSQACNNAPQVFWSGGDIAKDAAKQVASDVGGKTPEMTQLGTYLEQIDASYPAWQAASLNFANVATNASSSVYSIQNAAGIGLQSTWATIEYPLVQCMDIIYGVASQSGSIQIMP